MKSVKYWLVFAMAVLFFACKTSTKTTAETGPPQPSETVATGDSVTYPPVYIEGGLQLKKLFAGFPNEIRILTNDGNTGHLKVTTSYGAIKLIDPTKGLYSYQSKASGLLVEIIAEDTLNNRMMAETFELVDMPAPKAMVWTFSSPLPSERVFPFTATEIKKHNALILYHDERIPVLCFPSSYQMTRITPQGKRYVNVNESQTGEFTEETKAMIQAAEPGDIYVIEDIKTECTKFPIKDIVYTIR